MQNHLGLLKNFVIMPAVPDEKKKFKSAYLI